MSLRKVIQVSLSGCAVYVVVAACGGGGGGGFSLTDGAVGFGGASGARSTRSAIPWPKRRRRRLKSWRHRVPRS